MSMSAHTLGDGADIVLVHGWGLPSGIWNETAHALAENYRVTLIDLPGYGLSPMPAATYALEILAEMALAAAPEHAVWTGWSLGALVTMQAALIAPQRVMALVLVASTPRFVRAADWPHGIDAQLLDTFAQDLVSNYASTVRRFVALQARGRSWQRDEIRQLHARVFAQGDPQPGALHGGLALLRETDLRQQLANIAAPVLVLAGEHDTLVPLAASENLVLLLNDARPHAPRLHVMAGAGHAPFLSHPQQFLERVSDFVDEQFQPP